MGRTLWREDGGFGWEGCCGGLAGGGGVDLGWRCGVVAGGSGAMMISGGGGGMIGRTGVSSRSGGRWRAGEIPASRGVPRRRGRWEEANDTVAASNFAASYWRKGGGGGGGGGGGPMSPHERGRWGFDAPRKGCGAGGRRRWDGKGPESSWWRASEAPAPATTGAGDCRARVEDRIGRAVAGGAGDGGHYGGAPDDDEWWEMRREIERSVSIVREWFEVADLGAIPS